MNIQEDKAGIVCPYFWISQGNYCKAESAPRMLKRKEHETYCLADYRQCPVYQLERQKKKADSAGSAGKNKPNPLIVRKKRKRGQDGVAKRSIVVVSAKARKGSSYHAPSCPLAKRLSNKKRITIDRAKKEGFAECGTCYPGE